MQGWMDGAMAGWLPCLSCLLYTRALLESPSGRLSVQRTISRSSSPPPPSPGRHNNGGLFFLYIPHHQHLRLLWPRPRPLLSPGLALIRCTHTHTLQGCYFAPAAAAHYHIMCCELGPSRPHLVTIERRKEWIRGGKKPGERERGDHI